MRELYFICNHLEGVVSKRAGSFYKSGKSRNWLKTINPDFVRT
jgi:ATP-dependent DNA ligase